MTYVDENLIPGETVTYNTKLHWIVLVVPTLIALAFDAAGFLMFAYSVGAKRLDLFWKASLPLLLVGAAVFGAAWLYRESVEMAVTNKRVLIKTGVITRRTVEMMLNRVESIGVDQTLTGRMLNFGVITLRGTGGTPEPFEKIAHPLEFRRKVQEQMDTQQQALFVGR